MNHREDCFHLGIKALIFNERNEVLLLVGQHSSKKTYWDIPGGRLQKGEALIDVLVREIKEETGFEKVSDLTPFTTVVTNIRIPIAEGDVGLILSIYSCKILGERNPILSDEHVGFEWLKPKEAAKKLGSQYSAEFLEKLSLMADLDQSVSSH